LTPLSDDMAWLDGLSDEEYDAYWDEVERCGVGRQRNVSFALWCHALLHFLVRLPRLCCMHVHGSVSAAGKKRRWQRKKKRGSPEQRSSSFTEGLEHPR
jgi:hypothetical protein